MTPSASLLLLLLLLGLSQALPLQEEGGKDEEKAPDTVDITTNGSDEILLEGDLLAPRTRKPMMCWFPELPVKESLQRLGEDPLHHECVENKAGCFSELGRVGGRQVFSLDGQGCLYYGIIIQHEVNHALGFQHEQTRSDLNNYCTS
ncbi:hypothetical protein PFLUV_G00027430 [Perca fluviatilis]|uniref:Peptidase M12A domain-containing protein n=1 Tax=Perca fluviatilis TaxID=8168 RepID=A0A6A5ESE5_PERFL|nr:hypothetical protein PFLUV_G00027430 [Perca fluviatilis]